jgi:hypothetical protein
MACSQPLPTGGIRNRAGVNPDQHLRSFAAEAYAEWLLRPRLSPLQQQNKAGSCSATAVNRCLTVQTIGSERVEPNVDYGLRPRMQMDAGELSANRVRTRGGLGGARIHLS